MANGNRFFTITRLVYNKFLHNCAGTQYSFIPFFVPHSIFCEFRSTTQSSKTVMLSSSFWMSFCQKQIHYCLFPRCRREVGKWFWAISQRRAPKESCVACTNQIQRNFMGPTGPIFVAANVVCTCTFSALKNTTVKDSIWAISEFFVIPCSFLSYFFSHSWKQCSESHFINFKFRHTIFGCMA